MAPISTWKKLQEALARLPASNDPDVIYVGRYLGRLLNLGDIRPEDGEYVAVPRTYVAALNLDLLISTWAMLKVSGLIVQGVSITPHTTYRVVMSGDDGRLVYPEFGRDIRLLSDVYPQPRSVYPPNPAITGKPLLMAGEPIVSVQLGEGQPVMHSAVALGLARSNPQADMMDRTVTYACIHLGDIRQLLVADVDTIVL